MSDDSIGYWIAIATSIVTCFAAIYGVWREWQSFRQNQIVRLCAAATVAVRRTDAALVRPALSTRMADTINGFMASGHAHEEPTRFRTLLFRDLIQSMRLTTTAEVHVHSHLCVPSDEEKHLANSLEVLIHPICNQNGPPQII